MKKTLFLYIAASIALFCSCVDYSDEAHYISAKVQVTAPEDFTKEANLNGHTITLTNTLGATVKAATDANGLASFTGLIPDVYTVSTSWDITSDEYSDLTGDNIVNDGAVVTGNINNLLIKDDNDQVTLPTVLSINRSLVIGKIYYAGSKDKNNKNYVAGQYLELYNQSDEPVNVAGLYIGFVESNSTPAYTLEQLDEKFEDSVVICKQVFRIPNDNPHVIEPGKSVVITNSAINHTVNAEYEKNLLTADFEAKDESGKTINNPDVPALKFIYSSFAAISKINFINGGPNGVIIFKTDDNIAEIEPIYSYGKTKGNMWLPIPKKYVIDGVDILKYNTKGVDISTKHLYNDIDGGYATISAVSGYNAEVLYRKTSTRKGKSGQKILQDTNNSTNDFKISTTINIREYDD